MAISRLVSRLLSRDSSTEAEFFRCSECDATFQSSAPPDQTWCPICRSTAVSRVWVPDPQI